MISSGEGCRHNVSKGGPNVQLTYSSFLAVTVRVGIFPTTKENMLNVPMSYDPTERQIKLIN